MKIDNVEIKWLGHSGFFIKNYAENGKVIYIDPYNIKEGSEKADIILITHSHYDHCSLDDIKKIAEEGTKIFVTADSQSNITRLDVSVKIEVVEPGMEINLNDIKISTLPAYNTDKTFHPKEEGWVGYLIKLNGLIIYHAGDSDFIPEMQNLTGHNQPDKKLIAILPIGGKYTMNVDEAVEAVKTIKPFLAIPMHYGSIVGSDEDAKEFLELCEEVGVNCNILEKE